MTKTITINIPKPGDTLPFIVAEWVIGEYRYNVFYDMFGQAKLMIKSIHDKGRHGGSYASHSELDAFLELHGLPEEVTPAFTVAEVTE